MRHDEDPQRASRTAALSIPLEVRAILIQSWLDVRAYWRRWALLWGVVLVVSVVAYPYDRAALDAIRPWGVDYTELARWLSTVGRFENSSLLFAVGLGTVGLLTRHPHWRQAAVACLLAGIVAGLAVTVLRPGLGRARPHEEASSGFYFLEIDQAFHSMPSGHASTNAASAVAIARVLPPLALPAVVYTVGVGWSRLQLNRHHPTDILWGFTLGGTIGWAVAGAIAGRRPGDRSRPSAPS